MDNIRDENLKRLAKYIADSMLERAMEPKSEDWQDNLGQVVTNINNLSNGSNSLDEFIQSLRSLNKLRVTTETLGTLRHNYLKDI